MSTDNNPAQMVRVGVLQNLDTVLQQFGLNPETELAELDLHRSMIQDGDLLIHVGIVGAVLEHCARVTDCPDFSLRLAEVQDLSMAGALGLFVKTAKTLGEALKAMCQYQHVHHAPPVTWHLEDLGNVVTFDFFLDAPELSPPQRRLVVDLILGHGFRVIKVLSQGRIVLNRVMFRGDRSEDKQSYQRFFQAPIEFNAEADGLILPAGSLDVPLVHPDAQLHEALRQQISPIRAHGEGTSLEQEVKIIIRSLLPTGDSSLERVARFYACDKRTLQRYLRQEANISYQALLDDVRFDVVQHYLRDSNMPMTQLAYVTGFSNPSNFARAFRKRFGMNPKQWREQDMGGHPSARTRRLRLRGNVR